ncbi:MAG TPA: ribonuclease E/G [Asticcacaulis sp.]|nr:ribonuclease E/G [Asticcacaulis sp.]
MIVLHYDSRFGLACGAVYLDGRPHLYMQGYETDPSPLLLGVQSVARLKSRAGDVAFLSLAGGEEAVLENAPAGLAQGAAVEIEIIAEARRNKLARGKFLAVGEGDPRRVSSPLTLKDRLRARAKTLLGDLPMTADNDAEALDAAADEARDPSGPLSNGGYLAVEPTSGLIACDIDTAGGNERTVATPKAFAKQTNHLAVADLPRRLRLSNQAGLVVVDLIGRRHDGEALRAGLLAAFGPEAARIAVAPIGKFGTLEFVRPWGACPLRDDLSPVGEALYWSRQAVALSQQDRGRRILLRARQAVVDVLKPLLVGSLDPLAPMLGLEVSAKPEVIAL